MRISNINPHVLYNPFLYLAGLKSVIIGISLIMITSWLCFISGTHNYGLINISFAKDTIFTIFLLEHFIYWVIVSVLLFCAGLLYSKSKIRWYDVFGTQGIARFPLVVLPLIRLAPIFQSFPINSVNMYFLFALHVAMVAWAITLMYNAFKISCNLKSHKLTITFIICLFIAEVLSRILIYFITNHPTYLPL